MKIRQATVQDIDELFVVRMSVKENVLSDVTLVTPEICQDYLTRRGKGWVCEMEGAIVGFAIVDVVDPSIWALFVRHGHEGKGIGRRLHDTMLNWYFSHYDQPLWLGTDPDTRAADFYRRSGWREAGRQANGEIRFEMAKEEWRESI